MNSEIERIVWYDTAQKMVGAIYNPTWKRYRAPEGLKFNLVAVDVTTGASGNDSSNFRFQIYDGRTYSVWGMFPNIFDQSTLAHALFNTYINNVEKNLHNHECKEFTMSVQGQDTEKSVRFSAIVWYYLTPMSKLETLEYAVKQPRYKYRHGSARTLDRFED